MENGERSPENRSQERLTRGKWVALAILALGFTILGADKSPATRALQRFLSRGRTAAVTSAEISDGYRVAGTGDDGPVEMPAGAVTNDLLRRRGGFDWAFRVEPEGWRSSWRGGFLDGVTVFARGEVRPDIGTLYYPVPLTNGVSLLPEARWGLLPDGEGSVFSHAVTTNGSLLLDWRNALVERDPNTPTNMQMEIFGDGSFVWRTDGGSTSYLPVLPFDWDGDGLENSVDPEPLVPNPVDAHGTPAEWYRIVCSNVFTTAEDSNIQTFPHSNIGFRTNATARAYYFVDVVATEGPAPIYFAADRDSRLGSPVIVARAGETNRVPLLIGVEYAVTSTVPFSVTVPEGGFAEANQRDERNCLVKWPLEFEFVSNSAGGYTVNVTPSDPGGTFTWTSTAPRSRAMLLSTVSSPFCNCWSGYGPWVSFSCTETCGCSGDCRATGEYSFEDARFSVSGGSCRCGFDDPHPEEEPSYEPTDGPSFSIKFSKDAVIFEDAYDDSPGVRKPKRSTRVRLTVSAYGGPNGGTFILAPRNLGKLAEVAEGPIDLPSSRTLAAEESFYSTCIYEAETESGSFGDVRVAGFFIEQDTGMRINANADLTVVRVELRAENEAPENPCANRHQYGVGEMVQCLQQPSSPQITWTVLESGSISNSLPIRYMCPIFATTSGMSAQLGSVVYNPHVRVVEPEGIECQRYGFLPADPMTGVGMALELYLRPYSVSFEGLELKEVEAPSSATSPAWGTHSGYFNDPVFQQRWYHYSLWGAGVWRPINYGNQWGSYDQSRMFGWPKPWAEGAMTWRIPIAWRSKHRSNGGERRLSFDYNSEWTMTGDSIIKTKHGQVLTLSEGGQVFLNGEHCAGGSEDD